MKNIEKWLKDNNYEYSMNQYGNSLYFNDNFSVSGISISFYFDGRGNSRQQENILTDYMNRKKAYSCTCHRFGAGYTYVIMSVFDSARLAEHEKRVSEAVEAFWQDRHAQLATAKQITA